MIKRVIGIAKSFTDDLWYYLADVPHGWWRSIKCWLRCCLRYKEYREMLLMVATGCYPWDYGYSLKLQLMHLRHQLAYMEKIGEPLDNEMRYMKVAIHLLEYLTCEREPSHIVKSSDPSKMYDQVLDVRVNLKNKERFKCLCWDLKTDTTTWSCDMYEKFPELLYIEKAKRLYFAILRDFSQAWWT